MADSEKTRMEEAIDRMRELQKPGDTEEAHVMADEVLCQMLENLGCHQLVAEWRKIDKWYA